MMLRWVCTKPGKLRAVEAVIRAGSDFVKTSTGFGPSGATVEDVMLLKEAALGRVKVKAAGGIRTYEDAVSMIQAGADLIGTSRVLIRPSTAQ